jgi:hypothetical protein
MVCSRKSNDELTASLNEAHNATALLDKVLRMNLGNQIAQKVRLHHHELGKQSSGSSFELFSIISAGSIPNLLVTIM